MKRPYDEKKREALRALDVRYADDVAAQMFVSAFPCGATPRAVAEALGVNVGTVEKIERIAIANARRRFAVAGIDASDVIERYGHPLAGSWTEEDAA
jgi:hypothetical protein